MATRNVLTRQRGQKWSLELRSFERVKREMKAISKAMTGEGRPELFQRIADEITYDVSLLGVQLRDKIRSVARANDVPKRVQAAVFTYSDAHANVSRKWKRTALVGVRKGTYRGEYKGAGYNVGRWLMVEWNGTGKRISMSLSTIFEKGTKKGPRIRGKYYFLLSVRQMSAQLLRRATDIYKKAVYKFNRTNGN